jgi:hypothetical protein
MAISDRILLDQYKCTGAAFSRFSDCPSRFLSLMLGPRRDALTLAFEHLRTQLIPAEHILICDKQILEQFEPGENFDHKILSKTQILTIDQSAMAEFPIMQYIEYLGSQTNSTVSRVIFALEERHIFGPAANKFAMLLALAQTIFGRKFVVSIASGAMLPNRFRFVYSLWNLLRY